MQIRRRDFMMLLGSTAATSSILCTRSGRAQEPAKLWRVGIILAGSRTPAIEGFVQGMREFGYHAGRDYHAEWRFADGRYARFPIFAQDFVRLKTDVIFLGTAAAVDLVRQVTRTIPIVFTGRPGWRRYRPKPGATRRQRHRVLARADEVIE